MTSAKSKKNRARLLQQYGHRYKRLGVIGGPCFYCGEVSDTLDHCPPLSWAGDCERMEHKFYAVPSCFDCNKMLGDAFLPTLRERAESLERKLSTFYDKKMSLWTEDEIKELGYSLRSFVNEKQAALSVLATRIRYLQWRMFQYESLCETEEA